MFTGACRTHGLQLVVNATEDTQITDVPVRPHRDSARR